MGTKLSKEINEEKQFNLEQIDGIQVTMSSAPIHLIRTETSNEVKFHYYGKAMQEITLVSEISNKTLIVSARRKYGFWGTGEVTCLDIYLPGEYERNISIETSSGLVKMDSFNLASIALKTTSGGLEAENIQTGKTALNTSSGKIDIKALLTDELDIKGTSSSINIGKFIVKEARIKNTSGNVLVSCQEYEDANMNIETTSGNITLGLPGVAEFLLKTGNTSGKIQNDFPLSASASVSGHKIEGQVGTKSNTVALHATSGNIRILNHDR